MSTLFVKNLIFSGVHGSTGRERLYPQQFRVSIALSVDTTKAASSDTLSDTYDYKHAVSAARDVVQNKHPLTILKI